MPDVGADPVALAEMQTIQNTATVQPVIPEMNIYWGPAEEIGNAIVNGEVTHGNAAEKTEAFNNAISGG